MVRGPRFIRGPRRSIPPSGGINFFLLSFYRSSAEPFSPVDDSSGKPGECCRKGDRPYSHAAVIPGPCTGPGRSRSLRAAHGLRVIFKIPVGPDYVLLAGLIVMAAGYVLLAGGGVKDPEVFNYAMFDFRRLVAAPLVIICGVVVEIVAIMGCFKGGKDAEEK